MNKPLLAFLTLLALLFAFSIYQFFATHEYREVTEYTPFKGEARENPLYAARLFIRHMGIPAENKNDLQSLGDNYPDTHTTLMLDTTRATLSLQKTEKLLDWVRQGGHLITRTNEDYELIEQLYYARDDEDLYAEDDPDAENEDEDENDNTPAENYCPSDSNDWLADLPAEERYSRDPLQRVLDVIVVQGVYLNHDQDDSEENDDTRRKTLTPWKNIRHHVEYDIALGDVDSLLTLALDNYFYAIHTVNTADHKGFDVQIQNETFLTHRNIGKGHITLLADFSIFENQLLREADNAEILWHLLHTNKRQPTAVWLFHNDEMPNLFSLIWQYGWMVVVSLAALLIFWLYQSLHRFGPIIPKQDIARRRLLEHIDASGLYFWKNNQQHRLVASTRKALNQRIAQRHPGWQNSNKQDKVEHLAHLLERPVEDIKALLFTHTPKTDEEFVSLIQELENIRHHL